MDPLTPSTFLLNVQSHYKYTRLSDSSRRIRLAHIQKNSGGTLAAILVHHDIETLPSYDALSYEWGLPGDHVSMIVDGCQFRIQANLANFLNALLDPARSPGSTPSSASVDHARLLFVDAICVDQENVAERNQQVQLMRHIYINASSVLSWLGPSTSGIPLLCKILQAFALGNKRDAVEELSLRLFESGQDRFTIRRALLNLVARTYWSRTWIVQELILAKEIVVYCGESSLVWSRINPAHIIEAAKLFKGAKHPDSEKKMMVNTEKTGSLISHLEQPAQGPEMDENFDTLFWTSFYHSNMLNYFRWRGGWDFFLASNFSLVQERDFGPIDGSKMTLERALVDFASTKCLDPRDRIYALIGIVKESSSSTQITVNYGQNPIGLFFDVWQHMDETKDIHDHRSIREIVKQVFSRLGMQVLVSRGSETLKQLDNEVVDSIPPAFASRVYPVQAWRAGKLISPINICHGNSSPSSSGMSLDESSPSKSAICAWTVKRTMDQRTNDFMAPRKGDVFVCYMLAENMPAANDVVIAIDTSNCGLLVRKKAQSASSMWESEYYFVSRCVLARPPTMDKKNSTEGVGASPSPSPSPISPAKRTWMPFGRNNQGSTILDMATSLGSIVSSHRTITATTTAEGVSPLLASSAIKDIAKFLNRRLPYLMGSKYTDPEATFARPPSDGEETFASAGDLLVLSQDLDPGFFFGMQMADWALNPEQGFGAKTGQFGGYASDETIQQALRIMVGIFGSTPGLDGSSPKEEVTIIPSENTIEETGSSFKGKGYQLASDASTSTQTILTQPVKEESRR